MAATARGAEGADPCSSRTASPAEAIARPLYARYLSASNLSLDRPTQDVETRYLVIVSMNPRCEVAVYAGEKDELRVGASADPLQVEVASTVFVAELVWRP
jgi:hypothetical protein